MPIGVDLTPVTKFSKLPSAKACPGCRCYVTGERTEYISIGQEWIVNKGSGAETATTVHVDSSRTDEYSANGTADSPYTTLSAALAAIAAAEVTRAVIDLAPGAYSISDDTTISIPMVVYGNGSTITIADGKTLTITAGYISYDLIVSGGAVTFNATVATDRFILLNGSDTNVTLTLSSGTLDIKSRTQSGDGTVAVSGGSLVATQTVFVNPITQTGGAIMLQNSQLDTNAPTGLINSTGGSVLCENCIIAQAHATVSPVIIDNDSATNIFINCLFSSAAATANVVPVDFQGTGSYAIWGQNTHVYSSASLPSSMPGTYLLRPTSYGEPINAQTGTTYALLPTDNGKLVTCTNGSAISVAVAAGYFATGQRVRFLQGGAGQVTLAAGSGMTINSSATLKTKSQHSIIELVFTSPTTAIVSGDMAAS